MIETGYDLEKVIQKLDRTHSTTVINDDERVINEWYSIIHHVGNVNTVPALMKTKEQRRAELDTLLESEDLCTVSE